MAGYGIVLLVSALVTGMCTPVVRALALRYGAVANPRDRDDRHIHDRPVATLGGVAMFVGFAVAMGVASRIPQFDEVFHDTSEAIGVVLAAAVMLLVGTLDDIREVSPPAKLAGQVLAASILYLFGVTMIFFRLPFAGDVFVLSPDWQFLVTVAWVILLSNAINLIDGLDGLAAGIVAIAGAALFLYDDRLFKRGLLPTATIGPLIAALAVGACIGFLPWNVHRARIFMGDAGALFLGLLMASSTSVVGGRVDQDFTGQTYFFLAPLVIPLVILGVPIIDTAFAFLRRVFRGRNFAAADREHLHHRLMRLGHGHRRAVFILWLWTAVLSGIVLVPTYDIAKGTLNFLMPFLLVVFALLLYAIFAPGARSSRLEREAAGRAADGSDDGAAEGDAAEADATAAVIALEERRRARG